MLFSVFRAEDEMVFKVKHTKFTYSKTARFTQTLTYYEKTDKEEHRKYLLYNFLRVRQRVLPGFNWSTTDLFADHLFTRPLIHLFAAHRCWRSNGQVVLPWPQLKMQMACQTLLKYGLYCTPTCVRQICRKVCAFFWNNHITFGNSFLRQFFDNLQNECSKKIETL